MSYLVMECHPGYAVLLDEEGRFLKAANPSIRNRADGVRSGVDERYARKAAAYHSMDQ